MYGGLSLADAKVSPTITGTHCISSSAGKMVYNAPFTTPKSFAYAGKWGTHF